MHLVLKLVSSLWFWADIALSTVGGIIVWWGLRVEKKAEKLLPPEDFKPDLYADVIKRQKQKIDRGWRILMTGIVFEVVAAFGISIISGIEMASLENKASLADKDAGDAKALAAQIGTTNAQLVATNLWFANETLKLAQQIQDAAKTANEIRDLLGDSNTTARLNETKIVLAEASQVAADVHNVVTSSNLAAIKISSPSRTINPEQEKILIGLLKPWVQTNLMLNKTVTINIDESDAETEEYGSQIKDVLNKCGFEVNISPEMRLLEGNAPTGLYFLSGSKTVLGRPPQILVVILNAFALAGIEVQYGGVYPSALARGEGVDINVCRKPK